MPNDHLLGPADSRLPKVPHSEAGDMGRRVLKNMAAHVGPESYQRMMDGDRRDTQEISDAVPRGAYANGPTAFNGGE